MTVAVLPNESEKCDIRSESGDIHSNTPAPLGCSLRLEAFTIGTGASGEARPTSPKHTDPASDRRQQAHANQPICFQECEQLGVNSESSQNGFLRDRKPKN